MRSLLVATACLICLSFAPAVSAGSSELSYQAVAHLTEGHHIDVTSEDKRRIGIAAFRGLAIFAGGELANYHYQGNYDFLGGSGPIRGYAIWHFDDGSFIRTTYIGKASRSGDGILFSGTHQIVAGSGRFAGVSGSGTFEGRRVDNLDDGGDTYWSGSLSLTTP